MTERKIPAEYENPIDDYVYKMVAFFDTIFYNYNFTPNIITSLSLITGLLASYYLLKKSYLSIVFLLISYFLDYSDGYFARKHNMVTEFGDFFDHGSDTIKSISILYSMYTMDKKLIIDFLPLIILSIILPCYHFSLQEKIYDKQEESKTLNILNNYYSLNEKNIVWTRFFNSTTSMIFVCYLMHLIIQKK